MRLFDRERERQALEELVAAAAAGRSAVLVLHGEPGIGKTALLDHAVHAAAGMQVARVAGIESETDLCFAGLHRLLLPFLDGLDALPGPQGVALASAFGLASGSAPDRFLVGLATLTLLADAAAARPLVCVVDDAHSVDTDSLEVLGFVGRRLHADAIALLFAVRDPADTAAALAHLPHLHVAGLPADDAVDLLSSVVTTELDHRVADQLVDQTGGNPLALAEFAGELNAEQLAGASLLPEPLPLSRRLEARFLGQVRLLPPETQTFLLTAAAEPAGDVALLSQAAVQLGISIDAAEPAAAIGVLELRPSLSFRHPLMRSAVYRGAPLDERRRVHQALAAVGDQEHDQDRRAWHLAAAASGPDETVAAELARAAERARGRGGQAATAALLTRASQLTPEGPMRATRVLAAAQAHLNAGAPARARALLSEAGPAIHDPVSQAHLERLHGAIRLALGQTADALPVLLHAAADLQPFDVGAARQTLLVALSAAIFSGHLASGGVTDVARAARAIPLPAGVEPTNGDLLLDGMAEMFGCGHAAGAPLLRRAVEALRTSESASDEELRWLGFGAWAAGALADNERVRELATRLEQTARAQGALVALTRGLYFLAMAELVAGELTTAARHFAEGRAIMAARGDPTGLGQTVVLAWQGGEAEARAEAAKVAEEVVERGQGGVVVYTEHALAVLELGLGNYAAALSRARRLWDEDSYFLSTVALPDLVEAGARGGDAAIAAAALDRCAERALVNGTPLALGLLARSRALLADDAEAEPLYREAISRLEQVPATGHLGRAHLLYGEWLRRQKRRVDARASLTIALDVFAAMGASAFAQRAQAELFATGARARKRTVETRNELTPQEDQIARLAASGATNPEIAAKLFISAATVEHHLRSVYRKLEVTSRRRLTTVLPE